MIAFTKFFDVSPADAQVWDMSFSRWITRTSLPEGAIVSTAGSLQRISEIARRDGWGDGPCGAIVPEVVSDRQFFQQLAVLGAITNEEAIAAVATGTIPPAMEAFIAALPEGQQFAARMLLQGATEFRRSNPLVTAFGTGLGWTAEQIDQLWRSASAL